MKKRVLVVDDEQDLVELLRYNLDLRGYEVMVAFNGLEALNQARHHLPDLVILDLMMRGMDGFTVCEILRHLPSTNTVSVIMLTALKGEIARVNGMDSGADDYITKPFSIDNLMSRIEKILATRQERLQELQFEEIS